jgi:hydrogenase maturation protein HypF
MTTFNLKIKTNQKLLALGAELDTTLAYYRQGKVIISDNLGNTSNNPAELEKKIIKFCKDALHASPSSSASMKPDYILTDLHPEYNSTKIGAKLAKKWQIPYIKIQHHQAHIFSAIAEYYLFNNVGVRTNVKTQNFASLPDEIIGIACDGTGYGLDGTIWGGEVFKIQFKTQPTPPNSPYPAKGGWGGTNIERIAHLEQQTLLGGQLAVEEPARMLMAVLAKFLDEKDLFAIIKKFYDQKTFKLLYSQLQQNFNCQPTSSCARVLDAAAALLFGCNERKFKHQGARILEETAFSVEPYTDIEPIIITKQETVGSASNLEAEPTVSVLLTTPLFKYIIKKLKNLPSDKGGLRGVKNRLAATVHQYIAAGLWEITQKIQDTKCQIPVVFSGGMANNKIFHQYFESKKVLLNKKIPAGDPGISLGQVVHFLSTQL